VHGPRKTSRSWPRNGQSNGHRREASLCKRCKSWPARRAAGQLPLGFEAFYTGMREGMLVGRIDHVLGGVILHQAMSLVQLEVGIRVAKPVASRATSGATGATATSTRTIALATLHRASVSLNGWSGAQPGCCTGRGWKLARLPLLQMAARLQV
jgi:hypothetical protein